MSVEQTDARTVVAARGELDLATAPELEDALLPRLRDGADVVLDLCALEFMDSTGVRVIVAAHHGAEEHGGTFTLAVVPDGPIARVLEISGLDTVLRIVDRP